MNLSMNRSIVRLVAGMVLIFLLLRGGAHAGQWQGYRCDNARSGASAESLDTPLHLQWSVAARHAPRPAWPEPGKEVQRMAFDYAPQVAIADGLVVFGSTVDHKITALDLSTGSERWSVFTGGPIRFAPAIVGDRVYAASDDGMVYCLGLADGHVLWRFRGGPRDEWLMGNEQMISRWPARSGVLVEQDTLYATFGMWQSDGIYIVALNARRGSVLWKNDTVNNLYMALPHSSKEGIAAVSPQGQLALCGDTLVVPCGRAMPAGFDRHTGRLLFCNNASDKLHHAGGAWVMAAGDMIFGNRRPVQGHPHVTLREKDPPVGIPKGVQRP